MYRTSSEVHIEIKHLFNTIIPKFLKCIQFEKCCFYYIININLIYTSNKGQQKVFILACTKQSVITSTVLKLIWYLIL